MDDPTVWNSLQIVKIIISAATPVMIAFFGFTLNRRMKEIEQIQWSKQKAIEKRVEFYYKVVPWLNDIYCYFWYVGNWKSLSPIEIINIKRSLDKEYYINEVLLPINVRKNYQDFIHACFRTYTGMGNDAQLETSYAKRVQSFEGNWKDEWNDYFTEKNNKFQKGPIKDLYYSLVNSLAESLGIETNSNKLNKKKHKKP
jgi:hypothetical protein